MRSFAEWVSSRANSIEDNSEFIRPCSCGKPVQKPVSFGSELLVRMHLADMLIPKTNTESLVADWMTCFCISVVYGFNSGATLTETFTSHILGTEKAKEYYELEPYEAEAWLKQFKADIVNGKTFKDGE